MYAIRSYYASLPSSDYLERVLPEHFVMLRPRDIVSGDFYWVGQVDAKVILVAADCTGHGVPGAIMSMFGIAFLHEIIGIGGLTRPAEILNELRRIVIESLKQDENSEVKDGMDISIATIDAPEGKIEYAGAFNSMFLIRNSELNVIPADHMPVSYGEIHRSFTNHEIVYQPGDCFYLSYNFV